MITSAKRGRPKSDSRSRSSVAMTLCASRSYSARSRMNCRISGTSASVAGRIANMHAIIPAAMRKLLLAALVLGAVATALGAPASPPAGPAASRRRLEPRVTPEILRHSRLQDTLYFVNIVYSAGVLLLLLKSKSSAKLRDLAERATKSKWWAGALYVILLVLAVTLLELPLTFYEDYVVPHQFDLTEQTLASWTADQAKGLAVGLVISAIVGGLVLLAIRHVRRWWLAAWLGSIPLIVIGVLLTPLVIDP